jgi:hydrogenase/urease accessory protein HupE
MAGQPIAWAAAGGLCVAFFFGAAPAEAHLVNTRFGDFYDGMLHPTTAIEHMVPWAALGLLAGLHPKAGRWMLLTFPVGLAVGTVLARLVPDVDFVSAVNLGSFMLLGALVALALPMPAAVLGGLALLLGASHGYANGLAMNDTTNAWLFTPGAVTVGYLVVLLVAAVTAIVAQKWGPARIAVRAAGSWIFAIGVLMLGTSPIWHG